MKQIFPTSDSSIVRVNDQPVTRAQYDELVSRINEATSQLDSAVIDFNQYKQMVSNAFTTTVLEASNASINSINSSKAAISEIESDILSTNDLESLRATISYIVSTTVSASRVSSSDISYTGTLSGNNADIDNIRTSSLSTDSFSTSLLTVDSLTSADATLTSATVTDATVTNATVQDISSDTTRARKAIISELVSSMSTLIDSEQVNSDITYITHTRDPQEVDMVSDTGDYYILLPEFTNGWYYIEARNDTNAKLWSVEVTNSISNVQFRWSERELGALVDIRYAPSANGTMVVQIHANSLNEHITIYRQSQSTDNTNAPTIYDTNQMPSVDPSSEDNGIYINQLAGTYIQDVIFTNKLHIKCLEMDSLFMDCVGVYRKLYLSCDYEQSGDITSPITTSGEEGQYVINRTHCSIVHPTWESPAETVSLNKDGTGAIPNTMCDSLLASCTVARYDGTVKNGWTSCNCWSYPITNLGNCATAHGNMTVCCNMTVCKGLDTPHIIDSVDKTELDNTLTNMTTGNALVVTWTPPSVWTTDNFSTPSVCTSWYDYTDLGPGSTARYLHRADCPYNYICTSDGLLEIEGAYYITDKYDATWKSVYFRDGSDLSIGCVEWNHLSSTNIFMSNVCSYGHKDADAKGLGPWKRYSNGRYDELAAYDSCSVWDSTADGKPTVYDAESSTIKPSASLALDDLEVDNLVVNCDATIGNDLHVGGDLYVEGVTHTVEEETVSTSSDMVVLRQNNPSVISSGQASGIIINNATADGSIAVVTDSTGTLRIGTPDGTGSSYEEIYYKDGHWYSDIEEETEVTPLGELISWDSKQITENGSTKYVNAAFMQFDYTKLSPVLGRDEIASMSDNALLLFDKASWEAKTIAVPATNGSVLKYNTVTKEYYWAKEAGVYHFATMRDYLDEESDIPEDSIVIVDNEYDYTISEDKQ